MAIKLKPFFNRTESGRIARNTVWLIIGQWFVLLVNLPVGLMIARYLGPEQFGLLSYAIAVTALLTPIATLGLNSIVTRDLVREPKNHHVILGTTLALRILASLATILIGIGIITLVRPGDSQTQLFLGLLLTGQAFSSFIVLSFWFEAQVQGKRITLGKVIVASAGAVMKIIIIILQAPLIAFVITQALDGILIAIVFLMLYCRQDKEFTRIRFSSIRAKGLIQQSIPLIASSITAVVYLKIDQVMLGEIAGNTALGLYSIAARLSEVWYFIPVAIVTSYFPFLLTAQKEDNAIYQHKLQQLFDILMWLGIIVAIAATLLAPSAIPFLLGEEYSNVSPILVLHIWGGVFLAMRALVSKWLIAEQLLRFSLISQGAGALSNIALNLVLIPLYGGIGAAIATIISYFIAAYLIFVFFSQTRPLTWKMTLSMIAPLRIITSALQSLSSK